MFSEEKEGSICCPTFGVEFVVYIVVDNRKWFTVFKVLHIVGSTDASKTHTRREEGGGGEGRREGESHDLFTDATRGTVVAVQFSLDKGLNGGRLWISIINRL